MVVELTRPHNARQGTRRSEEGTEVGADNRRKQSRRGAGSRLHAPDDRAVQHAHGNVVDYVGGEEGADAEGGYGPAHRLGTGQEAAQGIGDAILIQGQHQDEHRDDEGSQVPGGADDAPGNEEDTPSAEKTDGHGHHQKADKEQAGDEPHGEVDKGRHRQKQDATTQMNQSHHLGRQIHAGRGGILGIERSLQLLAEQ